MQHFLSFFKMLAFLSVLMFINKAVSVEVKEGDCFRNPYPLCLRYLTGSEDAPSFPNSRSGLDDYCAFLKKNLDCLEKFDSLCPEKRKQNNTLPILIFQVPDAHRSYKGYVEDFCTPGTIAHDVMYDNVECIAEAHQTEANLCVSKNKAILALYNATMASEGNSEVCKRKMQCLSYFQLWDCFTTALGLKCNKDVEKEHLDMYYRGYEAYDCGNDLDTLIEDVDSLAIDEREKDHLKITIGKFRYD